MTKFTSAMLKSIAPHLPAAQREYLFPILVKELAANEINTYLRISAFLGQVLEESGEFSRWEENLNYSAQRLCQVWPKRFPSVAAAVPYAHNPKALAEKVYGGRMGNVNPGDGYKYRGRGPEQTTGHDSYAEAQDTTGLSLLTEPDQLIEPEIGFKVACSRWKAKGCNALADSRKFKDITLKINGGLNGYADRLVYYTRGLRSLPEDLNLDDSQSSAVVDEHPADVHKETTTANADVVLLPTSTDGFTIPAVVDEDKTESLTKEDLQNVVTGHSDSLKAIVGRGFAKFFGFLIAIWSSGIAGKLLLLAVGLTVASIIVYDGIKYWPRLRAFSIKVIKHFT